MLKKIFILLISVILLTGCSKKEQGKIVTFWTLQMGDFAPYINNIISEYETAHQDIKIKWIDVLI